MTGITPPEGARPIKRDQISDRRDNLLNALNKVRENLDQAQPDLKQTANHIKELAQAARLAQQRGE
jgi:hypothetical protein